MESGDDMLLIGSGSVVLFDPKWVVSIAVGVAKLLSPYIRAGEDEYDKPPPMTTDFMINVLGIVVRWHFS
jgi:hypothetical protein